MRGPTMRLSLPPIHLGRLSAPHYFDRTFAAHGAINDHRHGEAAPARTEECSGGAASRPTRRCVCVRQDPRRKPGTSVRRGIAAHAKRASRQRWRAVISSSPSSASSRSRIALCSNLSRCSRHCRDKLLAHMTALFDDLTRADETRGRPFRGAALGSDQHHFAFCVLDAGGEGR